MKKIIAIVAVIAVITACFCIGANAYEKGDTIRKGTIITFTDKITGLTSRGTTVNAKFESNSTEYVGISISNYFLSYKPEGATNTSQYINAYNGGNDTWYNNVYKTIKFLDDYTVEDHENIIKLFSSQNIEQEIKPPEPTIEKVINNTKTAFSEMLFVGGLLISWLMANQIALVGLYLYILIALVATGKRFITGV